MLYGLLTVGGEGVGAEVGEGGGEGFAGGHGVGVGSVVDFGWGGGEGGRLAWLLGCVVSWVVERERGGEGERKRGREKKREGVQ